MRAPAALRFALRELRGGLSGFYVFLACLALGVAAIAGVGSLADSLRQSVAREGRVILGGDIAFTFVQRQAGEGERSWLASKGAVSEVVGLRAMARRADGTDQALIELKAVDNAYPLLGALEVAGGGDPAALLAPREGRFGALVDEGLLLRLDLSVGDEVRVGSALLTITGAIAREPDKLAAGMEFGPRLMLGLDGLEATGLIQPGSLARWTYRVRMDGNPSDAAVAALEEEAKEAFPDAGWLIRARDDASPGLERTIDRLAQFLTLVGLAALIVGGVGVANAVHAFLDGKREVIASFKSLGAPGAMVVRIYLIQIVVLAGLGIVIGLAVGAAIPPLAGWALADVLPIPVTLGFYPAELALAALYGFLTALAFALWPLGKAENVPPTALFRARSEPLSGRPRRIYALAAIGAALALAILAILLSSDRFIALFFAVGAALSFLVLRWVAVGIMALARRAPAVRSAELRLALGNIRRPGALTPTVILSLGLGLTLLVTIALIDGNLRRELSSSIPDQAPSFFFLEVPDDRLGDFTALLGEVASEGRIETVPMLRGRITAVKGVPADQITLRDEGWVLRGDRGVTYSESLPANSRLSAGEWWPAGYDGPPLVSFAGEPARALDLAVGDMITVNVLGRPIEARIASLREVEWDSLAINFVLVFSPNTFHGAPHSHLATLTFPGGATAEREIGILRRVADAFPFVTAIRVKEALDEVNALVGQIMWAIRGAASVTLVTAMLVLGGALAAGHRQRIHDAVILKTLGATRRRLILAFGLEYLMLGLAAALFGVLAGSVAAWAVLTFIMDIGFRPIPGAALGATLLALLVTLGLGLAGTWRLLGQKAAPVLRNL